MDVKDQIWNGIKRVLGAEVNVAPGGVPLADLEEGDQVVGIARLAEHEEDDAEPETMF